MDLTPHQIGVINGMSIEILVLYTRGIVKERLANSSRDKMLAGDPSKQGRV